MSTCNILERLWCLPSQPSLSGTLLSSGTFLSFILSFRRLPSHCCPIDCSTFFCRNRMLIIFSVTDVTHCSVLRVLIIQSGADVVHCSVLGRRVLSFYGYLMVIPLRRYNSRVVSTVNTDSRFVKSWLVAARLE